MRPPACSRGDHLRRSAPVFLSDFDLHLIGEGRHLRLWEALGAHCEVLDGVPGVRFALWAPHALRVSAVGDFCDWDGSAWPLAQHGDSGVFEGFVPGVEPGALYKFEIETQRGEFLLKADPLARAAERPPATASRVVAPSHYAWGDAGWLAERRRRDPLREPFFVYEVHLGSWARAPGEPDRLLSYRELAPLLVEHAHRYGFTHVELMPVMEHPFAGSWGYQVTGYYAPTARHGSPDDLRFLVDTLHQAGIGVILDWVPAHFPRDDWALARFDGKPLYEHPDPRRGEHRDWGTLIFDYGRPQVRNFLLANALYWLQEFHADGLRVDAVASMLYLDYSRGPGEWEPNVHGGREHLEAIDFLRELNAAVAEECPGCVTIAEESTAFEGVTRPVDQGGLGFTFKWNMGWMHDTLAFLARDPIHRGHHLDQLTFAMLYEHSEHFLMPLSHDEVVHLKGSLLRKMHGDPWQRFANLRLLYAYQLTRPGKKLLFMGSELAPEEEWDHQRCLPWHLEEVPAHAGVGRCLAALGTLYRERPSLWRGDPDPAGTRWIDCQDRERTIVSYLREADEDRLVVVLNLTPVPRPGYRLGVPPAEGYRLVLNTDAEEFGGSGAPVGPLRLERSPAHGFAHSLVFDLPPLAAVVFEPLPPAAAAEESP
ncbi:MAG: 1,4-alpha-glucan branching protein GlgB [Planctomycetota bacterium]|nr:MAG: 1,4-alpha-glucan branching protein GlgB [Planctomycetota bacterium]